MSINEIGKDGYTQLHNSAIKGDLEKVKFLLENGASIDVLCSADRTPLLEATIFGRIESVKLLLDNKADVNIADRNHNTALLWAVENKKIEIVPILLSFGADINIKNHHNKTVFNIKSEFDCLASDRVQEEFQEKRQFIKKILTTYIDLHKLENERKQIIELYQTNNLYTTATLSNLYIRHCIINSILYAQITSLSESFEYADIEAIWALFRIQNSQSLLKYPKVSHLYNTIERHGGEEKIKKRVELYKISLEKFFSHFENILLNTTVGIITVTAATEKGSTFCVLRIKDKFMTFPWESNRMKFNEAASNSLLLGYFADHIPSL